MIELKRAYDAAEAGDGARFLVERLWPRGTRHNVAVVLREHLTGMPR
jgi:uncharacterized protein YeaO (DUF488 family)